ncbi:MAG: M4 family metallopeptidase [Bacteroidia bacterium]|nr:M4 family metallopeptidase [Bacteroidia bacterium]
MKKFILSGLVLFSIIVNNEVSGQVFQGQEAAKKIKNSDWVRLEEHSGIPSFIRFNEAGKWNDNNISGLYHDLFGLPSEYGFSLINEHIDRVGVRHLRYRQTYKGIPVEGSMFIVHSMNQKIKSVNGDIFNNISPTVVPLISESAGLEAALQYIHAEEYAREKWKNSQSPHIQQWTEKPQGILCIAPVNGDFRRPEWKLAYKYDIYATKPLLRKWVYVDAQTGSILWEQTELHSADVPGTAVTRYSGNQTIVAGTFNGGYRLREQGRSGVETYDMNQDTDYALAEDFTDSDNFWNNTSNMDEAATDAHWGAEMVYDYYFNEQGRNSIDDNGMKFINYVHYDVSYFNAFWNGQFATFGDGNSNPLTAIDISAHEFTHGVTGNSAGLIYQNESGALNEAFSDIFGTTIEFYARPASADWLIGGDLGPLDYLRSMSNPNIKNNPDTYHGDYWYYGTGDNGGVHSNSGVLNKWYYILSEGETDTNDLGNSFSVTGLGLDKAGDIAYKTLNDYLTPSSEYIDARFYSLVAAMDLYGACSPELEAVTNAWYAVGIGVPYQPTVTADFQAPALQYCSPQTVTLYNFSSNADVFFWDFGDGTTSSSSNPVINHTYAANGNYTVTLIASSACGTDTLIMNDYIQIGPMYPCVVTMSGNNTTQSNCYGVIYDDGGPNLSYSAGFDERIVISPTNAYKIDLNFTTFRLASTDSLFIYKGTNQNAPLIGKYSILMLQNTTLSINNPSVTIRLKSDAMAEDSGFVCNWSCYQITGAPVADFTVLDHPATCNGIMYFKDISEQATNGWNWSFGDGTTSTLQNPVHEYQQNGTYTVALNVSNSMGTDTEVKQAYITVNRPQPPVANDVFICGSNSGTLTASGSGEINWFSTSGNWLGTGSTFPASTPNTSVSYEVKDYLLGIPTNGGRPDNTGNGNYYNFTDKTMIFDVLAPCLLHAVDVYANSAGNRTVSLMDEFGTILQSRTVSLNPGYNKVVLNFIMNSATNLQLGITGTNVGLYRNTSGSAYPYNIGNFLSIIKSSSSNQQQYYFFYNWEVMPVPCISLPQTVTLYANGTAPQSSFTYNQNLNNFIFNAAASQGAQNYFWLFGDGGTGTGVNAPYFYTAPGTYQVSCITANGGCTDTMTQTVTVSQLSDINPVLNPLHLSAFPNPGNGEMIVKGNLPQREDVTIKLINALGQTLKVYNLNLSGEFEQEISLKGSTPGIYRIQIIAGGKEYGMPYLLK